MSNVLRELWDYLFNAPLPGETEGPLSREDILLALHKGKVVMCFVLDTDPKRSYVAKRDEFTGLVTAVTLENGEFDEHVGSDWLVDNFMLKYAPAEKWEIC